MQMPGPSPAFSGSSLPVAPKAFLDWCIPKPSGLTVVHLWPYPSSYLSIGSVPHIGTFLSFAGMVAPNV